MPEDNFDDVFAWTMKWFVVLVVVVGIILGATTIYANYFRPSESMGVVSSVTYSNGYIGTSVQFQGGETVELFEINRDIIAGKICTIKTEGRYLKDLRCG